MIKCCLWFLVIVHLTVASYFMDEISSFTLALILYITCITFIYLVLCCEWMSYIREQKAAISQHSTDIKDEKPNLYIKHWKEKILNIPYQFPLDRVSYLHSKFFICNEKHPFKLRYSELKILATKSNYGPYHEYPQDPYPSKLVNNLYLTYLHKRAEFYRDTGMKNANLKQQTGPHDKKKMFYACDEVRQSIGSRILKMYSRISDSVRPGESETSDEESKENTFDEGSRESISTEKVKSGRRLILWDEDTGIFRSVESTEIKIER